MKMEVVPVNNKKEVVIIVDLLVPPPNVTYGIDLKTST